MSIICWCGSEYPLADCHGMVDNWELPEVKDFKINLPLDITPQVKTNLLRYLNGNIYQATDEGSYLKFSSRKCYTKFFTQTLIYSKDLIKNTSPLPTMFKNWGTMPNDLPSTFVNDNIKNLNSIRKIEDINDFVNFKKSIDHIFFASKPSDFADNLKVIANKFLEFYPNGSIDFITVDDKNFKSPVMIRNFAKQKILGIELTKALLSSSWQEKAPMETGALYFDILFTILGGGSYGFASPWLDRTLLLSFGERVSFQYLSYAASYAKGVDVDFYESGVDKGEQIMALTRSDFRLFTEWYIRKLNRLLSYLTHLASFADRQSFYIDPVKQYKHYLTWEQLLILTVKIVGTEDLAIKKQLTFTFLDILAHLQSGGVIDHLFKKSFIQKLLVSFDDLPTVLQAVFKKHVTTVYDALFEEVFSEVIPRYINGDKVKLPSGEMDKNTYVGTYISSLRNTIHGYAGSKDYEDVIFINSGEIPLHLIEIVPILFLHLLIKPDFYFKSNTFINCF